MTRTKRSFTPEDRLSIVQEGEREGFMETCRKYNLSPALIYKWKQRYLAKGAEGLSAASDFMTSRTKGKIAYF